MIKTAQKKLTKKITADRLQNIALYYLERFGGTEKSVRDTLNRHIKKSLHDHPYQDTNQIADWLDTVMNRLKSYGYINDTEFAKNRIKILLKKGKSTKFIQSDLQLKGVSGDIIDNILNAYNMVEINSNSVQIFVQKHRLGVHKFYHPDDIAEYLENYNNTNSPHYHQYKKDLAKCARQGFSYNDSTDALLSSE